MDTHPKPPASLVVDTDTASDDAVALLLAARTPGVRLRAVTIVAGNVPLPQATRNALVTLDLAGAGDVPVFEGRPAPLMRPLETAQCVHGEDGMSGVALPEPARRPTPGAAVDALRRIVDEEPGQHTLVTLGPLSTVACALLIEPALLEGFAGVVCMAGAFDGVGNVNAVGEYNVWADPEAARLVFDAPGAKTLVGWDVSRRQAVLGPGEQARLRSAGPLGAFAVDINACVEEFARSHTALAGFDLPDPLAMAVALDPTLATEQTPGHVSVGLGDAGRGGTFVDHRLVAAPPNASIVRSVDEDRFKAMLLAACHG